MRTVADWDLDYILNGIPKGEFDWVEFKGSRSLDLTVQGVQEEHVRKSMSQQLSAFANSGGGAIVYGIKNDGDLREVDDGGVSKLVKANGTKEWMEDIIPNLLEFPLNKFNVYPIDQGDQIADGKALFVIDVPDSSDAPHQAIDKIYYARVGCKSRPISHRMVMDIAGRQVHPSFEIEVAVEDVYSALDNEIVPNLCVRYRNSGRVFANYVNGWIQVPQAILEENYDECEIIDGKKFISRFFSNTVEETVSERSRKVRIPGPSGGHFAGLDTYHDVKEPLKLSRYDPILPSLSKVAFSHQVVGGEVMRNFADLHIAWTIYADNAPRLEGVVSVREVIDEWEERTKKEEAAEDLHSTR